MNEDLSSLFDKLNINPDSISPDMLNAFSNMLNNNSNTDNSSNNDTASNSANNIDFETILKMKNLFDNTNSANDPRSNLLRALRPYLAENKQGKIDQYIQFIQMSKLLGGFPFMGGGKQNDGKL